MQLSIKTSLYFILSVFCTFLLTCIVHSQLIQAELSATGIQMTAYDRVSLMIDDLIRLLPTHSVAIFISMLLAFATVAKLFRNNPQFLYPVAGAIAICVSLTAIQPLIDMRFISVDKSHIELAMQSLSGAIGGAIFYLLRKPSIPQSEN